MTLTITESLAEIKTIGKRIASKQNAILEHVVRLESLKDPLEKSGGQLLYVASETQSVADLSARIIAIRRAIQEANNKTAITIRGVTRTIQEWLTWRREIAQGAGLFLHQIRDKINRARQARTNQTVRENVAGSELVSSYVVNVTEAEILRQIEDHDAILSELDGQLSLKNATTTINL